MIRANRFARIALRIARATKPHDIKVPTTMTAPTAALTTMPMKVHLLYFSHYWLFQWSSHKASIERISEDAPPTKWFWTLLLRLIRLPPPISVTTLYPLQRTHELADQQLSWRGPENCQAFSLPYVWHPPRIMAQGYSRQQARKCRCKLPGLVLDHKRANFQEFDVWQVTLAEKALCSRAFPLSISSSVFDSKPEWNWWRLTEVAPFFWQLPSVIKWWKAFNISPHTVSASSFRGSTPHVFSAGARAVHSTHVQREAARA